MSNDSVRTDERERSKIASMTQVELGRYYVPLRDARSMMDVITNLRALYDLYKWSFKPKEIAVFVRCWRQLRRLK